MLKVERIILWLMFICFLFDWIATIAGDMRAELDLHKQQISTHDADN